MTNKDFSKSLFERNVALFLVNYFLTEASKNKNLRVYIEKGIEKELNKNKYNLIFDLVVKDTNNLIIFECKNTLSSNYFNDSQFERYVNFFSDKKKINILKHTFSISGLEFAFFTKKVEDKFLDNLPSFIEPLWVYILNISWYTCDITKLVNNKLYMDKYFTNDILISSIKIYIPFDWTSLPKNNNFDLVNNKNEIKNLLLALQKFLIQNKWMDVEISFEEFLLKYAFDEWGNRIYFWDVKNLNIIKIFSRIFRKILDKLENFSNNKKGWTKFIKEEIFKEGKLVSILDNKKVNKWLKLISSFTSNLNQKKEKPVELPLFDKKFINE